MVIEIPQGYSVNLPVVVTDGPAAAADDTTPLTSVHSDAGAVIRVVYPDPTPGVDNPARSVRVDAIGAPGSAANIHAAFASPVDGAIHNATAVANVARQPNLGTAAFGVPGDPFPTPPAP